MSFHAQKARLEQPSKDDGQASGAASTSTSAAAAAASANGGGERKELFEMDGEYVGSISSNRRVAVRDFKNKLYVDIRETYVHTCSLSLCVDARRMSR